MLDAFVGSGTTLVAAERAGRRGYGVEIDPVYVDVALRRFRSATGIEPRHVVSGLTFAEMEAKGLQPRTSLPRYRPIKDNQSEKKGAHP